MTIWNSEPIALQRKATLVRSKNKDRKSVNKNHAPPIFLLCVVMLFSFSSHALASADNIQLSDENLQKIEQYKKDLEELENQSNVDEFFRRLRRHRESHVVEIPKTTDRIKVLESEIASLQREKSAVEENLLILEERHQDLKSEMSYLERSENEIIDQIGIVEDDISKLKAEMRDTRAARVRFERVKTEIEDDLNAILSKEDDSSDDTRAENEMIRQKLDEDIEYIENRINSIEGDISNQQNRINQEEVRLRSLRQQKFSMFDNKNQKQARIDSNEKNRVKLQDGLPAMNEEIDLRKEVLQEQLEKLSVLESMLFEVDLRTSEKLTPETQKNDFKLWITAAFAALVGAVILGFFIVSWRDPDITREIFAGDSGIQFITLFSLVIAIILFGITGILEGKELAALLGGISGYILGRGTGHRSSRDRHEPRESSRRTDEMPASPATG